MKRCGVLIVALMGWACLTPPVLAQVSPVPQRPSGYVNDEAGLIMSSHQHAIEALAKELDEKTTAQLAVVTVKSVAPETIETFAVRLFEQWGVGQQDKDNGVLLLVALEERKVRIEVGYGLESVLTDVVSRNVIERFMIPAFRKGEFSSGILTGVKAIVSLIAEESGAQITGQESYIYDSVHHSSKEDSFMYLLVFLGFFFLIFRVMLSTTAHRGYRRAGYWYGGGFGGYRGGFGGGFGGFGGGMSGGGGASGGW